MVWDYQLVSGGSGDTKMEVVLVAIKADLLDDLNSAVQDAGLQTSIVDVAPMALYNAFRYNYSDVDGCSLIIDIGARTTNLLFVDSKKVFSRSIPIGGSTITAGIAKEFNEPVGAAEERKKKVGFVSLGGAYAEPSDPDVSRVSKIVRNTMTRLHAEISRSISFYRAQQQGSQPVRVFLCGGSSSLPYMREFFHEKLQLPIEFFNSLRNVSVSSGVNQEEAGRAAHVLGELVGLSLRSVTDCPMELNLQPEGVLKAKELSQRRPYIVMAGICLLLIIAGFWAYYWRATQVEQAVLETIQPKVASLQNFSTQFDTVKKDMEKKKADIAPFLQVVNDREYWIKIIDDLNTRLPDRLIWITSFQPGYYTMDGAGFTPVSMGPSAEPPKDRKFGVLIKGLYLDLGPAITPNAVGVVDAFSTNLDKSSYFDLDPKKRRTTPTGADWAYDYEFHLFLKKPISLQ